MTLKHFLIHKGSSLHCLNVVRVKWMQTEIAGSLRNKTHTHTHNTNSFKHCKSSLFVWNRSLYVFGSDVSRIQFSIKNFTMNWTVFISHPAWFLLACTTLSFHLTSLTFTDPLNIYTTFLFISDKTASIESSARVVRRLYTCFFTQ